MVDDELTLKPVKCTQLLVLGQYLGRGEWLFVQCNKQLRTHMECLSQTNMINWFRNFTWRRPEPLLVHTQTHFTFQTCNADTYVKQWCSFIIKWLLPLYSFIIKWLLPLSGACIYNVGGWLMSLLTKINTIILYRWKKPIKVQECSVRKIGSSHTLVHIDIKGCIILQTTFIYWL